MCVCVCVLPRCPPCRGFTPVLRKTYQLLTEQGKPFELVYISSDSSQSEFDEYYNDMPWMAVPWARKDVRAAISRRFGVSGKYKIDLNYE